MDEQNLIFDLERMIEACKGPFITIPHGMRGDELRVWIREQVELLEKEQQ